MAAEDEELSDVEDGRIVGRRRAAGGQHEAHDRTVFSNEKWEPALRFRPVERQLVVTEAPIRTQLDGGKSLAQVVYVQLEEVRQQRGIADRRHFEHYPLPVDHANSLAAGGSWTRAQVLQLAAAALASAMITSLAFSAIM